MRISDPKFLSSPGRRRVTTVVCIAIIITIAGGLFASAPKEGNFWWSEAPRHALNGAFLADAMRELPLSDPVRYAANYYLQYPALTILFYPPLFALLEAGVFMLTGVTPWSAQLSVSLLYCMAGVAAFAIARWWLSPWLSLAVASLFMGAPAIALWGRQVMLEIPAYTFLLWATYALFAYVNTNKKSALYMGILLYVAGLYTKQTTLCVLPIFALVLWYVARRQGHLRQVITAGAIAGVLIIPLAILTWQFGQVNIESVMAVPDAQVPRLSIAGWSYYFRLLPSQIGWIPTILGIGYLLVSSVKTSWRLPQPAHGFFVGWLLSAYLFFSYIDLKEPRHSLFLLFPFFLLAVWMLSKLLPERLAVGTSLLLSAVVIGHTLLYDTVPYVDGHREASEWIVQQAPEKSIVLFSGDFDGSFIFNLRSQGHAKNIAVLRADKLFLKVKVRRTAHNVQESQWTEEKLLEMLNAYGVRYVVCEPTFWADLLTLQQLMRVVSQPPFVQVAKIPIKTNIRNMPTEIIIYENQSIIGAASMTRELTMDVLGGVVSGRWGQPETNPTPFKW